MGRIPLAGIAGQERSTLLRRPVVGTFQRAAARCRDRRAVLRSEPAAGLALARHAPYDFLVQSASWKIGAVSIAVLRRQYDKTYVAAAFTNQGRAVR